MAINRQKLKLLYLMRMLEEETDAERGLTMAQIIGKLEALGISAERKSIYRDIEALREFGVDVRTYQRAPVEYAVEHRAFAFAELQLLVDAVQSSRFLTQRKSDALVEGVKQLASRRQRALLDKRVHVEGRIKMQNESVFGSVDRIQEAIALKRRISFVYFKYDAAKRKALQHNGERYIETPVQLVYAEGYYYLVVFNEKHDDFANYRVDRMDRIEVLDEPALKTSASPRSTRASWKAARSACTAASRWRPRCWWTRRSWARSSTGSARTWSRCRRGRGGRACTRR